jgi:hypothetical protein
MANANRFSGLNLDSTGVPDVFNRMPSRGMNHHNGIFVAKVVDVRDEHYQGNILVEVVGQGPVTDKENSDTRERYRLIRMTTPFGGAIHGSNYTNSYGSTFHPPAPGSEILVGFTGGDNEGFYLGSLSDAGRNSSVPGLPASDLSESPNDPTFTIGAAMDPASVEQQRGNQRPRHPIANAIALQGLGYDAVRGVSSSGARRESPSNMSGFLTPGGHSITMDDGTVAYQEGVVDVPDRSREEGQSNLIRIRTGSGAQILLNDSAGIVYVINQAGTGWVQIDNAGHIDVFGQDSISMRTANDFNIYADNNFNVEAEAINMKARGADGIKIEAASGDIDIRSNLDTKITADVNMHLRAEGFIRLTAPMIDLNGPAAEVAEKPGIGSLPVNREIKESINPRVPEHEPWGGHDEGETRVPAQARSSLQTATTDYDLASNTGGGGGNAPATSASGIPATPGLSESGSSVSRFDATDPTAARRPTPSAPVTVNPRTGTRFDDPNGSGGTLG